MCSKSEKRDSNSRPQPWQGCALPTELFSLEVWTFKRGAKIGQYFFSIKQIRKKRKKGSPVSRVLYPSFLELLSLIWDVTHVTPLSVYPPGLPKQLSGPPMSRFIWPFNPQGLSRSWITPERVGSYPTFSPLPLERGGFAFCDTFCHLRPKPKMPSY